MPSRIEEEKAGIKSNIKLTSMYYGPITGY